MQYTMEALEEAFEEKSGIEIEVILGSSGKLTAQIQQGAPYDLFLSADNEYAITLSQNELTVGPPQVYARGQLVLWSLKENLLVNIESLEKDEIEHIALANPKTAPYGKAADEVLKKLRSVDQLVPKLVYGESISQVNQFIATQAADIGFTSKSTVIANPRGNWITIPDSLYSPIEQYMVIIKNQRGMKYQADAFAAFLLSKEGQEILNKFGYKSISL